MEKAEARQRVAKAVGSLTPAEREERSAAVKANVLSLPEIEAAQRLMAFLPMPDEVQTRPLLAELISNGKKLYVPRTIPRERRILPVRLSDMATLRAGHYGIPEPVAEETCDPADLGVILIPGRAFDATGNRLGRGAGYYDRFLARVREDCVLVGVCFECQILNAVPHGPMDHRVQIVVTERRILRVAPD